MLVWEYKSEVERKTGIETDRNIKKAIKIIISTVTQLTDRLVTIKHNRKKKNLIKSYFKKSMLRFLIVILIQLDSGLRAYYVVSPDTSYYRRQM